VTVNVGVIGVGMIGQDHIRRLTRVLSGARVVAVADADLERARTVAAALPGGEVHETGEGLIGSPSVDAVLVTSWGGTHERYVLAALAAGKPVFCEKPLATTTEAGERIMDAEVALGRRLVQVGFMRRYDARYRELRAAVRDGGLGAPLLMHAAHRNPSVPDHFTSENIINDSCVHDIDVARWMFACEVAAVTVFTPRRNRKAAPGFDDPLLVLLEMDSGVLVDVEMSLNAGFGYDIRGEVVCEDGTAALSESSGAVVKHAGGYGGRVPSNWPERFSGAFDVELQEWLDTVAAVREAVGPSVWDGYAVTLTCEAALAALRSGTREPVKPRPKPDLYG
jgi:myo-inositol 2-dehydrogenase/D-chiro-inositol 1-dehydrogenase